MGLLLQGEGEQRKAIEQFTKAVNRASQTSPQRAQYEIGRSYTLLKNYQQGPSSS